MILTLKWYKICRGLSCLTCSFQLIDKTWITRVVSKWIAGIWKHDHSQQMGEHDSEQRLVRLGRTHYPDNFQTCAIFYRWAQNTKKLRKSPEKYFQNYELVCDSWDLWEWWTMNVVKNYISTDFNKMFKNIFFFLCIR